MHKFRTILSVVATAAMVLGTMGVASAAGASNETRADFIVQLDQSLGIQPVTPSTPDFSDVPSTNADYGYIEAAYQKGFINGIAKGLFGPTLPITRAEAAKILVEAYEGGNYTPTQTSTTFTDNASIPTALVGYVAEANSLKLMLGFTSGSFGPEAYLTTAQETHLIAQLQAVQAAAGFKVSASSTDVGIGQLVTLSSTGSGTTTYAVTGANASSALLSGSTFVASAAGNYVVTGTNSGNTASVTIGVYGAATALKISAPKTVVANGASQTNVTVSVVDANGNVVANSTDNVELESSNSYAAGVSASASVNAANSNVYVPLQAVNGVATYTLTSGSVPGSSATLTAQDLSETFSPTTYTAAVTTTAQVATSIGVTPEQNDLSVNASSPTENVDVQVLDQTGNPMLYGTYPFSVKLSGPATFADGATGPESFAYNGTGPSGTNTAYVAVDGLQGQTGAVTVTASGTNLKSGTGTITAVISGSATAIQLTAPTTTSFAQGSASSKYTMSVVDAHGYPVTSPTGDVLVTIKDSSGNVDNGNSGATFTLYNAAGTAALTPVSSSSSGTEYAYSTLASGFTVFDTATGSTSGNAGSYTIQLTDESGNSLTASSASAFTVTAASAHAVTLSGATVIGAANPVDTITAQIVDAYGNDVSVAGGVVNLTTAGVGTAPTPTLSATQLDTNSSGAATVTATVPAYTNDSYSVTASSASYNGSSLNVTGATLTFEVESTVATSVQIDLQNLGTVYPNATSLAQAADEVQMVVYANDQYGNAVSTNDLVKLSFSGTGSLVTATNGTAQPNISNPGTAGAPNTTSDPTESSYTATLAAGKATLYFYAYGAGNVTVTGTDESAPGSVNGTASMSVLAQPTVASFNLNDQSGNAASGEAVTAGTPETLTLTAADALGNTTFPTVAYAVYLQTSSATGSFRLSTTGADVQTVVLPAGSSGLTVYYLDGTSGTPTLTTPAFVEIGNVSSNTITFTPNSAGTNWSSNVSGATFAAGTGNAEVWTFPSNTSGTANISVTVGGHALTFQVTY